MMYKKKQKGVYTIEFAIVASIFFILFFAVLEFSRLMYTWNVLTEISRRGARLATVCNVLEDTDDQQSLYQSPAVLNAATFADINLLPNLSSANLNISYLNLNGSTATSFSNIRLVRAKVVDYQHQLLIPFFDITLNSPSFSTTLPAESLGVTRYKYTDCL
ncbi:TadE/TadG family type IV pilus assembly protein [Psychromonas hadalis]|uniref:TadE/TadG family type IV pilus assembly protein n=1 Tax=Psychromonas hadalis TaxID=211669 RepID=UPI0003B38CA5|nr:TadE/TadG family type IV pilus assembly protein [Psychromonas hadalis]